MIFWLIYLAFIGILIASAVVVQKAELSGPAMIVHALIAIMAAYGFYKLKYPTYTYRYRMTVEVDAGGEAKSGSSVIEVTATRVPQILTEVGPYEYSARGQAVFLELPNGKNLVVLLTAFPIQQQSFSVTGIAFSAFRPPKGSAPLTNEQLGQLRGRRELPKDQMPALVTVSNPADEDTVRPLKVDDIDNVLGVHLRSLSIEMTDDRPASPDIEHRLPFVTKLCERRLENRYPEKYVPNCSDFLRH